MGHHFEFQLVNLLPWNTSQSRVVLILVVKVINPFYPNHQWTYQKSLIDLCLPVNAVVVDYERLLTLLVAVNQYQGHYVGRIGAVGVLCQTWTLENTVRLRYYPMEILGGDLQLKEESIGEILEVSSRMLVNNLSIKLTKSNLSSKRA